MHNKPKAEVHPGHKLTGPKEEELLIMFQSSQVNDTLHQKFDRFAEVA
jgi:hypothetical protein